MKRKKVLILFALMMASVTGIQAQDGLKWGAVAGINSSTFSTAGFDSKVGFHVGVKAEKELRQIAEGIYLDMAALLSLKGTEIKEVGHGKTASIKKFTPYYLEIPIHMGYKCSLNDNIALFGNLGPYFSLGLFGNYEETGGHLATAPETIFGDNKMKRFDFGLGLKVGVEFCRKFQVSSGYDWGMIESVENSGGNKNRNLTFSLGYLF